MKAVKMVTIFVLTMLMTALIWGQSEGSKPSKSAIPKFEGSWVLNREKSSGLTGALDKAQIRLIVTQDAKQLTAEQKVVIREREQPSQELKYKLDGSESEAEVARPMAGIMKLKAHWFENSKTLELQSTISGESEDKEVTISTQEQWHLIDANTLKITRNRKSPQGIQTFKLVFQKQ